MRTAAAGAVVAAVAALDSWRLLPARASLAMASCTIWSTGKAKAPVLPLPVSAAAARRVSASAAVHKHQRQQVLLVSC